MNSVKKQVYNSLLTQVIRRAKMHQTFHSDPQWTSKSATSPCNLDEYKNLPTSDIV